MLAGDEVQVFLVDRLIAYTIAQTCRQPGLSVVYGELFSFEDAAIYYKAAPTLVGKSYGEAVHRLETATLMGLRHQDGEVKLNPPAESLVLPSDRLIALAANEDSIQVSSQNNIPVDRSAFHLENPLSVPLDRLLILGWNHRAPLILEQLASYMPAGSEVQVVATDPVEQMQADCTGKDYLGMQLCFQQGSPIDRLTLEKLVVDAYQYFVVLSQTDVPDVQLADATTMLSVLHLRDIARKTGRKFSIVSEILDVRNRDLTEVTSAEDVIISERLVALALTQVAENKDALPLFADLLTPGGPEIYLKPVIEYVLPGRPISFHTVIEAALSKNQTAIGYRLLSQANQPEVSFGVHLNPEKSLLVSFSEQDRIIVLAEG
jgi:hypothetical protein